MATVPDPDLEIGGGERGGVVSKTFLRPFGPQFGLKIRGGGAAPLDLSLGKILTDKARVLTSLSRIMDLGLFLVNAKLSKLELESTG